MIDRMRDRALGVGDLNQLRLWIEWKPEVPEGDWWKDFGSFKICGQGSIPEEFLLRGQAATGKGRLTTAVIRAELICQSDVSLSP